MSTPHEATAAREIARVLVEALERLVGPSADATATAAARDAAQLLGLDGLDRVLAVCEPHAGRPWPAELKPVLERVHRLAADSAAMGSLDAFRAAGPDLLELAREIQAIEWSEPAEAADGLRGAIPTLSLARVLEELPLVDEESRATLAPVRLTAPVAAALRASLDWLALGSASRAPLRIRTAESTLEVQCERVNHQGLTPASEVLAAAGGHLVALPIGGLEPQFAGPWVIRVPRFTPRKTYLMLIQGDLKLAIPWHAVLRLRMVPAHEIDSHPRILGATVLDPLVPLARSAGEHPVALVAHGLKRASLVADRLVWRLEAQPARLASPPPLPGLSRAVETDEGEVFWLAEPSWLLERVPAPLIPAWEPPRRPEAEPPVLGPDHVESLPATEPPRVDVEPAVETPRAEPMPVEPLAEAPTIEVTPLHPSAIEPILETAVADDIPVSESTTIRAEPVASEISPPAPVHAESPTSPPVEDVTAPIETPPPSEVPTSPPELTMVEPLERAATSGPHGTRSPLAPPARALIAEDSIAARIFLSRLLEQQGIMVRAVATGEELFAELYDQSWSLICVDVELPDAAGTEFLRDVMNRLEQFESPVPLLALVRDAQDVAAAAAAGIRRSLRKPYERDALVQALERLGLGTRRNR